MSLPKGGGAVQDIGEKFSVSAATGTAALTIPVATSPGRAGFGPSLGLSYDSGSGNGPFGLGWKMVLPAITRKTDKGLPRYLEDQDTDTFLLAGAEDLVPVRSEQDGCWRQAPTRRTHRGRSYLVQGYRPRVESLFARIERWREVNTGETHWRSISSRNVTTVYGCDPQSRIADPDDPARVFSWLISATWDDIGNVEVYDYAAEDSTGIDLALAGERNRSERSRSANRYLKRIRYGNRDPWPGDALGPSSDERASCEWLFETVFDYGDHRLEAPGPRPDRPWPVRRDPFSTYRPGFEVRTYRRCRRVLMFHHFPDQPDVGADCLVASTDLVYAGTGGSGMTSVVSFTRSGYRRRGEGYLRASMPPLELSYSSPEIGREVAELGQEALANLPAGVDGTNYEWADLDGEGLSGILSRHGGAWFYKANLGGGHFAPTRMLATQPAAAGAGTQQQLLDLAGDGHLDLAELGGAVPGAYLRWDADGWQSFRPFGSCPRLLWDDPDLRMLDLDGDGLADVLITGDDAFTWYPSFGVEGFGEARRTFCADPADEERGPRLMLADAEQSIYVADMCGDGLPDLVRVRNGEVCYWPNTGYGRFGARVVMDHSPWMDRPGQFDQRRVRFGDADGTGTADLIYLGADKTLLYLNQSGNGYAEPHVLPASFPRLDELAHVVVADLLGRGTGCLVWSSSAPADQGRQIRYLELLSQGKPYLLTRMANNLGAETHVSYAPSTEFYLADRRAGRPWISRLPFPVQVVDRVETIDRVNRNRFVTRYAYHHGYYDGPEREFRGFGMVEHWDTEDLSLVEDGTGDSSNLDPATALPPVLTRTWLHTGRPDEESVSRSYAREYWRQPGGHDPDLPDSTLPDTLRLPGRPARAWTLSVTEAREARRALKGMPLREEVYALDGSESASRPYLVTEHTHTVELLQPGLMPVPNGPQNYHAILFAHSRSSLSAHYERAVYQVAGRYEADPRISQDWVLAVDDYGNPLRSVAVAYGRRLPDPALDPADRWAQSRLRLTHTEHAYTNPIESPDVHRSPAVARERVFEVVGLNPAGRLFRFAELVQGLGAVAHDLPFQDWEVDADRLPGPARRLLIERRTRYRRDDLSGPLPFGRLESRALPQESYRLAFTDDLLGYLYGDRVEPEMLADAGGYVRLPDALGWWAPSGQVLYSRGENDDPAVELEFARRHFFSPARYRNPFGADTKVHYDDYTLLRRETRDALGNRVTAGERDEHDRFVLEGNDYRVLQPRLVMDANRNRAAVAFDALAMVTGTAVMGKPGQDEGDTLDGFDPDLDEQTIAAYLDDPLGQARALLGSATSRLLHDLHAYVRSAGPGAPAPPYVATITRDTHVSHEEAGPETGERGRLHTVISYSDGFGKEIQKKVQAEHRDRRWIGSGWTIFDNKGNAVQRFEPFFTAEHRFESSRVEGVSTVTYHDPFARVIGTLQPNWTFEKVVFDPWSQQTWDSNDTVLLNPRTDPDVAAFFARVTARQPDRRTWYDERAGGELGDDERAAAEQTARHADTPVVACFDALQHTIANRTHNRLERDGVILDEYSTTRARRDVQDYQREILDPLQRVAARFGYDMLGKAVLQSSSEAGAHLVLADVGGSTAFVWNSRGFRLRHTYDELRRAIGEHVRQGEQAEQLVEYTVYGEAAADAEARNLRGKNYLQFDSAGLVVQAGFDFKGNLLRSERRLTLEHRTAPDWDRARQLVDASTGVDPAGGALSTWLDGVLDAETFAGSTSYDAHDRPTRLTSPDGTVCELGYNDALLLERVDVMLPGGARSPFVSHIDYNARGQRIEVVHGNQTRTRYEIDRETFRLSRLSTARPSGVLQDYRHTYDPVGNLVVVRDRAQPEVFHDNSRVSPDAFYNYDALYQLARAEGREHIGQVDSAAAGRPGLATGHDHPHDRQAMRRYCEVYHYDVAGNLLHLVHQARNGGWTRHNVYEEISELAPGQTSNRLSRTIVGETVRPFSYDPNGNTVTTPSFSSLEWDHADQLSRVELGGHDRAFYSYDTAGRRVRKTIEHQGGRSAERIYIGAFEIYRRFNASAGYGAPAFQRNTVHVYDNENRVALIETITVDDAHALEQPLAEQRYQFANGMKSVTLETDAAASLISYEEYYPFGASSYRVQRDMAEVSSNRYRYVGKERDEETGFYYYGGRYYDPSLARWISCDPAGLTDGSNLYRYVKNNPINFTDPTGQWEMPSWRTVAVVAAVVVVGTIVTVATAGAAGPLVVGAVASVGLTGTAATVATGVAVGAIAGAVGGAAAGAAGEATRQTVNSRALGLGNEQFSASRIGESALREGIRGAAIGAAVGGAAAFATTAAGSAAIGAAGRLAQRVAPGLSRAVATGGRALAGAANSVSEGVGLTALSRASQRVGTSVAGSLFQEGSTEAQAVARFAETGSIARTFGSEPRPGISPPPSAGAATEQTQSAARAAPASEVRSTGFGGWRATWSGDNRALVAFEPHGNGVDVTDLFRGGQPHRSGGQMLADSLRRVGITQPGTIRGTSIINQETLQQLEAGVAPGATRVGKALANAATELGGTVTSWRTGVERGKAWIEAIVHYR